MHVRFECPKCGTKLAVPQDLAGRGGICPRCGTRSVVPISPPESQAAEPTGELSSLNRYPWHVKLVAIAAGLFILLVVTLCVFWPRSTWEQGNRDRLLGLCNEASALAKMGDLARFNAKHAELLALVGSRKVEDQELKAALQRVEDAGNILVASTKREDERVGQAEAVRRQAEQERQRLEAEARLATEEMQRQKEEAERLALEEKKRREDAESQRRAEEEEQRLAAEARQNAEKERERLVAEANHRAEEENQRNAEAQRQAQEQQRRVAEAKQQAAEEQRRQETLAALTRELGRITASLEQAKAEGRAAVQERNQLQYKYHSERKQVQ